VERLGAEIAATRSSAEKTSAIAEKINDRRSTVMTKTPFSGIDFESASTMGLGFFDYAAEKIHTYESDVRALRDEVKNDVDALPKRSNFAKSSAKASGTLSTLAEQVNTAALTFHGASSMLGALMFNQIDTYALGKRIGKAENVADDSLNDLIKEIRNDATHSRIMAEIDEVQRNRIANESLLTQILRP